MLGARGGYSHSERIPPCHSLCGNVCLLVHSWPLLTCFVAMHHLDQEEYYSYLCCCSMSRGEEEVRSVVAHNVHEDVSPVQEGGVGLLLFCPFIESLDMAQSGKDKSGLGRWTTMMLQGDNIKTRIVCGYNPCKTFSAAGKPSRTSYAQQQRYLINTRKDKTTCPRTLFREEIIQQLKKWRLEEPRLIVCMDTNDHIY
jgi:hypothetical protein